jgi:hypothetical protein
MRTAFAREPSIALTKGAQTFVVVLPVGLVACWSVGLLARWPAGLSEEREWAQESIMRTLLALVVGSLISTTALAGQDYTHAVARSAEARVRPQDPRLVELLRAGVARSATFRALVDRLEAGNVIVYVSLSQTLKSGVAGHLTWMTKAGSFRYLRATLSIEQTADQMIATLAHELQHALEVSADANVTDQRSLMALYKRIGKPSWSGQREAWETEAAQNTGYQVRRELVTAASERSEL